MEYEQPNEPLTAHHSSIGQRCPFCQRPFAAGDVTKFHSPGPADDVEVDLARRGLAYVCGPPLELHYDCGNPKQEPIQ
jgi:hypothetical protein